MKRSAPMKRTQLRVTSPAKAEVKVFRPKKCKGCHERFTPSRQMQIACSIDCARLVASEKIARAQVEAARDDKRQIRAQLEALKTIPQLKKEAQREFNRFIRARDRAAGHACISSNNNLDWGTSGITGSKVDAGHYRSTGAADHLRFNEDNCHAQSVRDNRDLGGNAVAYRVHLIARIGLARVEALECNNEPVKWTRDGLREIRDTYRAKARQLEKHNT
jgi:hypothetical protein